jgi:outer membrane protein TolC
VTILPLLLSMAAGPSALDSLEEAYLQLALRRNLSLQADSLDLAASRETRAGARTLLGPQAQIAGSLSGVEGPGDRTLGSATGTGTLSQWVPSGGTASVALSGTSTRLSPDNPAPLSSGDQDTASLTVSFKQPLLQGFGTGAPLRYQLKQADAAARIKFQTTRGEALVLLQQARNAFWNLAGATATLAAKTEDSIRTERLMQVARVQFASGSASALDTLTAAANLATAKVTLLQGRNSVREGFRTLATLADTDQVVVPRPDTLPAPEPTAVLPSIDELVKGADERAPTLAQAQLRIEALQSEVEYRRSARLPKLDGTVYGRTGLPGGDPTGNWLVGARLDFDWLLPNGTDRAKYRTSLLDLRSAQIRREAAQKELRRQIERIVDAWMSAREQLGLSIELAALQRKRLTAAEVRYNTGSTSLIDLQTVRTDWMNALTSSWQAKAQLKSLEAELEVRTGIGPARRGWSWEER